MISLKATGGWTGGNQVPPDGGALAQLGPPQRFYCLCVPGHVVTMWGLFVHLP